MFGADFAEKCIIMHFLGLKKNGKVAISRGLNADTRENIGEMRSITMKEALTLPPPADELQPAHLKVSSRLKTSGRKMRAYEVVPS
jgi:hypothetical protein